MGNVIESFFSGLGKSIGEIFGSPVDFLSGKSCRTICGSTWDFTCYIENFCVVNLLKMVSVLAMLYIVLLFFYILYKAGIFKCVGHSLCWIVWSCFSCWLSAIKNCFAFLCYTLCKKTSRRHRRNFSGDIGHSHLYRNQSLSYRFGSVSHHRRHRRHARVGKSLRPRSHRAIVRICRHNRHNVKLLSTSADIRVVSTTRFSRKATRRPLKSNYQNDQMRRPSNPDYTVL